ncbi:hypothetical protein [Burkholderia pseudomallei]|nr:hypothetical protein [Burkholderia pseudomallei]
MYRKTTATPALPKPMEAETSAFVPVVTIDDVKLENFENAALRDTRRRHHAGW